MEPGVLLIGNGAREHAIAHALARSSHHPKIFSFMTHRNPGIASLSTKIAIGPYEPQRIVEFSKSVQPAFAFIGPEAPLEAGVADALQEAGIPCVGPTKRFARIETSKAFARELLDKYGIPGNPRYRAFKDAHGVREFLDELEGGFVVKADGLRSGKGVKVSGAHLGSVDDGLAYAKECLAADGTVLIEEKLEGEEFSLMAFTDGAALAFMPCVQDHKRAHEGDTGPNTGGMGSYSDSTYSLPFLTDDDVAQAQAIMGRTCSALREDIDGRYHGILYGGFMATAHGVRLIEYNARLGDPEAMNALALLETDLVDVSMAICNGTLARLPVRFARSASVCKYVVPHGYPERPVKGVSITIEPREGVQYYYAAIDERDGELVMTGSRAVAVLAIAPTIAQAERLAEEGVRGVHGPVFHRKDIGTQALLDRRKEHMEALR
jgi:phosphoribosylamine--glycine ligase